MSIPETIAFDKDGQAEREPTLIRKLFLSLVILLVAVTSFGAGMLVGGGGGEGVSITYDPNLQTAAVAQALPILPTLGEGGVIASKNGSKYHYLHCPGAKQIKEGNKIAFATPQAAEAAGYTLAANCQPR